MRKEVFPKENGEFIFPIADGRIKTPGGDQELRTSTLIRERPIRGESHVRRVSSTTSRLNSGCRWSDKWFLVHVWKLLFPPSRWTKSQTLPAERRLIPYSTEIHWRLQNYTQIWMLSKRNASKIIGILMGQEICLIIGQVSLSLLYWKKIPDGLMWSGERLTRKQLTSRPDHFWPELWEKMGKNAKLKERQK